MFTWTMKRLTEDAMKKRAKKPNGFKEFDALARKLVQVQKAEVDRQIERTARKKAKRKK